MTSRRLRTAALAAGVALGAATGARSAPPGPRDPDWPCQQIKVPQLSLAAVWSGPALDAQQNDWRQDQQVVDLVQATVQRRMPMVLSRLAPCWQHGISFSRMRRDEG
jgi:hypothetical protein